MQNKKTKKFGFKYGICSVVFVFAFTLACLAGGGICNLANKNLKTNDCATQTVYESDDWITKYWYGYQTLEFSGGDGTAADPYIISSAEELAHLSWLINCESIEDNGVSSSDLAVLHYKQVADIDLAAHFWMPIGIYARLSSDFYCRGTFYGHYDGNGHRIDGLNVDLAPYPVDERMPWGLFGSIQSVDGNVSTIENLTVSGVVESTSATSFYFGGIVGESSNAVIKNCKSEICIDGGPSATSGGIVGYSSGDTIQYCEYYGMINNSSTGGGIVGLGYGTNISFCVNNGTVYGEYRGYSTTVELTGGIAGYAEDVIIDSCISSPQYGPAQVCGGGIVGRIAPYGRSKISNCAVYAQCYFPLVCTIDDPNSTQFVACSFYGQILPSTDPTYLNAENIDNQQKPSTNYFSASYYGQYNSRYAESFLCCYMITLEYDENYGWLSNGGWLSNEVDSLWEMYWSAVPGMRDYPLQKSLYFIAEVANSTTEEICEMLNSIPVYHF